MRNAQQSDCQSAPRSVERAKIKEGQKSFVMKSANQVHSQDGRSDFYTGNERVTLQGKYVQRVRELQEINDNLQRQIIKNQKDMPESHDPLSILADIEHCYIMITRNTGEIMNIYTMNENRLKRIAELEAENINLQQEISDAQGKFSGTQEMDLRTKFATDYFANKARYEKNLVEIQELSQE